MRILIVEDDAATRRALVMLLTTFGHDVRSACDVAGAMRLGDSHPFHLWICDNQLPDGQGSELVTVAHALGAKAIQVSASPAVGAPFDARLNKPVDLKELLSTIHRLAPQPTRLLDDAMRNQV